jgi:FkbM family methyltransferase
MVEKILKLIQKILNYFLRKGKALNYHIELYLTNIQWYKIFKDDNYIIYELSNKSKIKLYRNNRLTEYILFQKFEEIELKFFEVFLKKNDFVIDIGANIGLHSIYCSKIVGDNGKIFSFEPTPNTFKQLSDNIELNKLSNVLICNFGISDCETKLMLNTSEYYNAWNTFTDIKKNVNSSIFERTIEVDVLRLDKWIVYEKIDFEKIALVKIDVEGWEKFVIQGASKLLSQPDSPAILIEFDENNTWAAGYLCHELYNLIVSFGYEFFIFDFDIKILKHEEKKLHYPSQNLIAIKKTSSFSNRINFE